MRVLRDATFNCFPLLIRVALLVLTPLCASHQISFCPNLLPLCHSFPRPFHPPRRQTFHDAPFRFANFFQPSLGSLIAFPPRFSTLLNRIGAPSRPSVEPTQKSITGPISPEFFLWPGDSSTRILLGPLLHATVLAFLHAYRFASKLFTQPSLSPFLLGRSVQHHPPDIFAASPLMQLVEIRSARVPFRPNPSLV